jgi:hypothetical protein
LSWRQDYDFGTFNVGQAYNSHGDENCLAFRFNYRETEGKGLKRRETDFELDIKLYPGKWFAINVKTSKIVDSGNVDDDTRHHRYCKRKCRKAVISLSVILKRFDFPKDLRVLICKTLWTMRSSWTSPDDEDGMPPDRTLFNSYGFGVVRRQNEAHDAHEGREASEEF